MPLSSCRMHKIYIAATTNYVLGSIDPMELAYYIKIRKEIDEMKKNQLKKEFPSIRILPKEWINESKYFRKFDAYWSTFIDDS